MVDILYRSHETVGHRYEGLTELTELSSGWGYGGLVELAERERVKIISSFFSKVVPYGTQP